MANLIEINIRANDQATAALQGVHRSLGDIGSSLIGVGSALTLATAPLAAFLGTALKQASDQQTAMAQLEAVIRSTGGAAGVTSEQALDLADSLSKVTRFSDDAILSAENLLLTFTSIGKDIFPDVTKIALDMSTALGQDLQSSVMQLGKALNDPISGLTALRRVGVQFTDAQQEMIEAMVTSGDLMGAQRAILAELTKEFGGSAEAAGNTFAGKLDILKNKFGELQEKIGFLLMPVLERFLDIVGSAIDKVTDWTNANPGLTRVLTLFAGVLVTLGPLLIGIGTAMRILPGAIRAIGLALSIATGPIGLIVLALGALALAFETNFLGIRDLVQPILDTIGAGLEHTGHAIGSFVRTLQENGIVDAIAQFFGLGSQGFGESWLEGILFTFGMAREEAVRVSDAFEAAFTSIRPVLEGVVNGIQEFVAQLPVNIGLIPFYFEYAFNKVKSAVETSIVAPLRGIWRLVEPHVERIVTWFATDFLDALIDIDNWVYSYVTKPLQKIYEDVEPYLTLLGALFGTVMNQIVATIQPVVDAVETFVAQVSALYAVLQQLGGVGTPKGPESKPTNPGGFPTLTSTENLYWANARGGTPKYAGGSTPFKDFGGRGMAGMPVSIGIGAQPEVFIPDQSGSFYPRGEGMGGGTTIAAGAVVVNVYGGDPVEVEQAVYQAILKLRNG